MDDIEKDYEIEISKEAKKELELIKKSATSAVKSKLQRIRSFRGGKNCSYIAISQPL